MARAWSSMRAGRSVGAQAAKAPGSTQPQRKTHPIRRLERMARPSHPFGDVTAVGSVRTYTTFDGDALTTLSAGPLASQQKRGQNPASARGSGGGALANKRLLFTSQTINRHGGAKEKCREHSY